MGDAAMRRTTESETGQHGGRPFARLGFGLGTAASLLANVLAQRITPPNAAPGWTPNMQAEIGATLWPVFLLITVEILVRSPRGTGPQWGRRVAVLAGVIAVLAVSACISYSHILAVLQSPGWNYSALNAHLGPLAVDGLMTVSGLALLDISQYVSRALGAQPTVVPRASTASAPEQAGAVRVTPSPRTAPVTTLAEPVAIPAPRVEIPTDPAPVALSTAPATAKVAPVPKPKREVVDIAEGVSRRDKMFAHLDAHPDTTGAQLDGLFGTKNYGRGVLRAWKAEQSECAAIASGE